MSRRELLARLALLLVSLALSLVIAEALFRAHTRRERQEQMADDGWRGRITRMNRTIYRRSEDPLLVYEPRPESAVEMPYGLAGFNGAGMRDDEEHSLEPGPRTRVVVLGDSIVWSENVVLEDSLPRALGEALGRDRFEVLGFGVTGYDTRQEVRWYERAARRYRPAVVVLVYCLNDAMIMSGPYNAFANEDEARRKEQQDAWLEGRAPIRAETLDAVSRREEATATLSVLARARALYRNATYDRSARYTDEYLLTHSRPEAATRARQALGDLGRALEEDGARGVLVISPVLRSWDRYHWGEIHRRVASWGREAGLEVVDPLETWRTDGTSPEDLRLPGDSLHYGARGNRLLARVIAEALVEGG